MCFFDGIKNQNFNLLTEQNHQLSAHFVVSLLDFQQFLPSFYPP